LGESEKFFAQRWRPRRTLFLADPLPDLFLQEWTDMRQFGERSLLCHQITCLDLPEESAAGGAAIGALQNVGGFAGFA
jgi:hypothetical protein